MVAEAWRRLAPNASTCNCYGMTEMCSSVSRMDPDTTPVGESVGLPYRGVELRIGAGDLPIGEPGEIWLRRHRGWSNTGAIRRPRLRRSSMGGCGPVTSDSPTATAACTCRTPPTAPQAGRGDDLSQRGGVGSDRAPRNPRGRGPRPPRRRNGRSAGRRCRSPGRCDRRPRGDRGALSHASGRLQGS